MTTRQEQLFERHHAEGMRHYREGEDAAAEHQFHVAVHLAHTSGITDERLGSALYQLGEIAQSHGHLRIAEQYFQEALAVDEQALGPDHPFVAMVLRAYAALLKREGQIDAAARLTARAEAIWGGPVSPHAGEHVNIY